jgi:hypothetical protein
LEAAPAAFRPRSARWDSSGALSSMAWWCRRRAPWSVSVVVVVAPGILSEVWGGAGGF